MNEELEAQVKEIAWYRCRCGKAFSNEIKIEKPDVNYNTFGVVIRYYFEDGTVLYPPGGGTHTATCYGCAEGS